MCHKFTTLSNTFKSTLLEGVKLIHTCRAFSCSRRVPVAEKFVWGLLRLLLKRASREAVLLIATLVSPDRGQWPAVLHAGNRTRLAGGHGGPRQPAKRQYTLEDNTGMATSDRGMATHSKRRVSTMSNRTYNKFRTS